MNEAEMEAAIVALRLENAELHERVADLECRIQRGHNCVLDLCSLDENANCRWAATA